MAKNDHYATSNTALAAYLHYSNIKLLSVEYRKGRGFFLFSMIGNHNQIEKLVEAFQSAKAPEYIYYMSYRYILDQLAKAK